MVSRAERYTWGALLGLLVALAVPWFMWGVDRLVFGLPVWLWWHIGWLVAASTVFWLFARRAWGVWIVDAGGDAA